ncbi:DUF4153 domain-containing protein [uncultured Tateyamaria sp.]|uniref:DUF4153 domain-containing protein n=1 Tax=uncultured Tateyamaria sp. TaxID=455651 RepID=UPI00262BB8A8|nr:DUF4173 domain-containing protein [uncultured Tateyamaria sp.]
MKTMIVRGIPLAMQQDGWWLNSAERETADRSDTGRHQRRQRDLTRAAMLGLLIALGDALVWQVVPGLSLAVLGAAVFLVGLGLAWPRLSARTRVTAGAGAMLSLLPLVELVQPLSVLVALAGLSAVAAVLAGVQRADLMRAALRLWWIAPTQTVTDSVQSVRALQHVSPRGIDLRALAMGWALPGLATLIFGALLAGANPVLDRVLIQITTWEVPAPDMWRLWFWTFLGAAIWPVLVAYRMRERLRYRRPARATVVRPGLINAQSVARSLVAFNALFAVQTGMDVLYLYGDVALPEGISPASYAHRGAYPLLATALLAGLFAVLARPHLGARPVVRMLMMLWLAQTLALVFASVWRLDLYVDTFGLTRLRLAAYIWMDVVAVGLGITAQQVWQDRPTGWMTTRCAILGAVVLYACTIVNFDNLVAQHNLTRNVPEDRKMLCELSEAAMPAITRLTGMHASAFCDRYYFHPTLFQPDDWREWGFRNWRVRRSLAAIANQGAAE